MTDNANRLKLFILSIESKNVVPEPAGPKYKQSPCDKQARAGKVCVKFYYVVPRGFFAIDAGGEMQVSGFTNYWNCEELKKLLLKNMY